MVLGIEGMWYNGDVVEKSSLGLRKRRVGMKRQAINKR